MKAHNFLIINLNLIKQYRNLVILILIIVKFNNKMIKIIKFLIYNKWITKNIILNKIRILKYHRIKI